MRPDFPEWLTSLKADQRKLALIPRGKKDRALLETAKRLKDAHSYLLEANEADISRARLKGLTEAMIDRLKLTPERIRSIADGLLEIAALEDPIGGIESVQVRPNGIKVGKMRIPLGVILIIYESRPNVTIDAAALCMKSGNGCILKGGKEAFETNQALVDLFKQALEDSGLPSEILHLLPMASRSELPWLLSLNGGIDLVIPRGGEDLVRFVTENAKMPVIQHFKGVCHAYIEASADLEMAKKIVINAKTSRPSVCNALETLLVDKRLSVEFLRDLFLELIEAGVEIRACRDLYADFSHLGVRLASDEDFGREFLSMTLAAKRVEGLDGAIEHIERFGSLHTEVIVTNDLSLAEDFLNRVEASCVMVNASSRFNDGYELGLGAEIGISTSKIHAFGPMGLKELTAEKFIVIGKGQVRLR
jgi:glutamate-5-semialdehyde dehydrogenase